MEILFYFNSNEDNLVIFLTSSSNLIIYNMMTFHMNPANPPLPFPFIIEKETRATPLLPLFLILLHSKFMQRNKM